MMHQPLGTAGRIAIGLEVRSTRCINDINQGSRSAPQTSMRCCCPCSVLQNVHSWEGHRVPGRSEAPTDTSTTLPHPHAAHPATQPPYLLYQQKLISVLITKSGYPACLPPPGRALMLSASQDPGRTGSLAHPR